MTDRKEKIDMYGNKLKEWDEKIIEAQKHVSDLKGDLKDEAAGKIGKLRSKLKSAEEKLQNEENEPKNFWDDLQNEIKKSWTELEETMKNVYSS